MIPKLVTIDEVREIKEALEKDGLDPLSATRGDICRIARISNRRARTIVEWLRRGGAILIDAKREVELLKEQAKQYAPYIPSMEYKGPTSGNMVELAIPDLHCGKLAWSRETNWSDWSLEIAQKTFWEALTVLVQRSKSLSPEEIVFVVGNDMLHTDNLSGTTTAGTPQDVSARFHQTYAAVRKMLCDAVDWIRQVAPVRVVITPGNHDQLSAWTIGDSLECYFHTAHDVTIMNEPTLRKYYAWGRVMLMWTHGSGGKLADMPLVMATEQPVMWGQTTFRECHTGHKHTLQVSELHGVRVRISPALCASDAWHSKNCFVGNQRAAEAFGWNRDEGLIAQFTYTVPENC